MKAKKWFTNNFGLKAISLVLAVITWLYTNLELAKRKNEEERAIIDMLHYEVVSKRLPIQLTIVGKARQGFALVKEGITVQPESIVVVGPKSILEEVDAARTIPIDISEYTKDIKKDIPLAPLAAGIALKGEIVSIFIPIVKAEEGAANKPAE